MVVVMVALLFLVWGDSLPELTGVYEHVVLAKLMMRGAAQR